MYAGPGYRAAFLSNSERQAIFDNDMLPRLQEEDLDGALLVALEKIDANATPEHASRLEVARQVNAVVGLVGAPVILAGLVLWAVWNWMRFGRDPRYLDDPSIHIPAPPAELTPATGALLFDGRSSRRALTAAMLDLASRGLVAFREESSGLLGRTKKVGIEVGESAVPEADPEEERLRQKAARRPLPAAEQYALTQLRVIAESGYIEPDDIVKFGPKVAKFEERLEAHAVKSGWLREAPKAAVRRWQIRGVAAFIVGGIAVFGGFNLPSDGLVLLGIAAILGGSLVAVIAHWMPARTVIGAMLQAMLMAYRRTLEKSMAKARTVQEVVDEAGLDWLETPDQAVVWSVALGLGSQIEEVIERSVEDVREGRASGGTYIPGWYHTSSGGGGGAEQGGGGGLFASSAVPNFGGMMSAISTIGNSPSSSGGGGFGGGSSGGGGGGSGGGF
jgi:hypothetical protein